MSVAQSAVSINDPMGLRITGDIDDTSAVTQKRKAIQQRRTVPPNSEKVVNAIKAIHDRLDDDDDDDDDRPQDPAPPSLKAKVQVEPFQTYPQDNTSMHGASVNQSFVQTEEMSQYQPDRQQRHQLQQQLQQGQLQQGQMQQGQMQQGQMQQGQMQQGQLQQVAGRPRSYFPRSDNEVMMEKLNFIINLLEDQHDAKTNNVTEEVVLYAFLGVFIIFVVDSFTRAGKYTR